MAQVNDDAPGRAFPGWNTSFVNEVAKGTVESGEQDDDALADQVSELNISLIKLGHSLQKLSKDEMSTYLKSLRSNFTDLPGPEHIISLASADGAPPVREYLDIVNGPIDIELDDEKVWPMPPLLAF